MNRPLRSSTANSRQQNKSNDRMRALLLNMGFFFAFIFAAWLTIGWMLSDVTGEYAANDPKLGIVRLSLVRRATNIKGELSCGSGALLEVTTNKLEPNQQFKLNFELPQHWIDEGQTYRSVQFIGKIDDEGTATGVIREGAQATPVKLQKNGIASVYRQIQSHLPFAS